MDDSAAAILQNRISQLERELTDSRAATEKWKGHTKEQQAKNKALRDENEQISATNQALTAERDQYKTAMEAKPHELQTQVDEYRAKLRDRDHRDKFHALAKKAGVTDDKALGDLYQLSGYKPEADDIDETKITAAISTALQGRDWLKSPAQAAGAAATAAGAANGRPAGAGTGSAGAGNAGQTLQPGPGASRGGASVKDDTDSVLEAKYPNAFRLA